MSLAGKVCLVTGASRGIGRGIALQLGEAQATVYITGRTLEPVEGRHGSLNETSKEIENRGGRCIPVVCDHSKEEDIKRLFEQIDKEQDGQLDILVNNAYSAVHAVSSNMKKKFWEQPLDIWDTVNNVGLRNYYVCSTLAARMMVPRKKGLIVMISSPGGLKYTFNVAYGVGKAAVDRLAADCAVELRKHNVACVCLWPSAVRTENMMEILGDLNAPPAASGDPRRMFALGETTEYAGKCVVGLASDTNIMKKSGRILITSELADEYGFTDIDGRKPPSIRKLWFLLEILGYSGVARFVPGWVTIPCWALAMQSKNF